MKKRILSGMRPTGRLHLGHLVGALDNWKKLQDEYECFYMVADWHALMSEYEFAQHLPEYAIDNVIDWMACGIDPEKSTVFIQSEVAEHLDLYMIFSCFTALGMLERCPTYKEQLRAVESRNLHTYGFLGYPVLQAADILLYKAQKVPVGQDQLPHLELTREIADRFNSLYKNKVFPAPEAILSISPKLLGLDGRKMSKSYNNTINLSDSSETIIKKAQTMFTDPKRIRLTDKGHPNVCNVYSYYAIFVPEEKDKVIHWCTLALVGCTECKKRLAEGLIEKLKPLHEKRKELMQDKHQIAEILKRGKEKASCVAAQTLREARRAMKMEFPPPAQ